MADADALPPSFSSFDLKLPADFGSTGMDTVRAPADALRGTGTEGLPNAPATWGDVLTGAEVGAHEAGASLAGGVASIPGSFSSWDLTASQQQAQAEQAQQRLTPGVTPGLSHPMVWAAEQAPGLAAYSAAGLAAGPAGMMATGALMTRGDVYNRLTAQGIKPDESTLTGATLLGAGMGIVPEAGGELAGKIATSPLVDRALGVAAPSIGFGAGQAGQEAISQQAEIRAGKRTGYDVGAIGSEALGGAEFGAGFSAGHLFRSPGIHAETGGTDRNLTQTGGEATVARTSPATEAKETKPRARTAPPSGDPSATGPAPPSAPNADPTLSAGAKGEPITPGVKQPVVSQAPSVQPGGEPAQKATEAPPAPVPPAGQAPPSPTGEARPAPAPAPPTAEQLADLQRQHAELGDPKNPREAMAYPPGVEPFAIAKKPGRYGAVALDDGTTIQYDKHGPNKLTKDKVADLAEAGQLDPLTDPRPVAGAAPAPAPERAPAPGAGAQAAPEAAPAAPEARGEPPPEVVQKEPVQARVVEEPAPLPVRERAPPVEEPTPRVVDPLEGSTKLAQSKAGIELHQMPDGSYKVRKMDGTVMDAPPGQARAMFPNAVPEAPEERVDLAAGRTQMTPELQAAAEFQRQRRVLQAQGEEEERAQQAQREAQEKAAAQEATKPVTRQTKEPEAQQPGKDEKRRQENIANNKVADQVMAEGGASHLPSAAEEKFAETARGSGGEPARKAIKDRVARMVEAAKKAGYEFSDKLRSRKDPEEDHTPAAVILHLARDLNKLKVPKVSDFIKFKSKEDKALKGEAGKQEALKERRAEGREFAAAKGETKEKAVEDVGEVKGIEEPEKPDIAEEYEKAKERVEEEKVAKAPGEERKLTENERRAQEASERARAKLAEQEAREQVAKEERAKPAEAEEGAYSAGKMVTAGFKVEQKRRPIIKREEEIDEDGRVKTVDHEGNSTDFVPIRSTTAREAIEEHFDLSKYPAWIRPMLGRLRDAVVRVAGDTPVHYVSDADMERIVGGRANGAYNPKAGADHILLNNDRLQHHTAFHEAFHAATQKALLGDDRLYDLLDRLRQEVRGSAPSDVNLKHASMTDPEEFLTYIMTHPQVAEKLSGIRISDQLAKDIGIPKWRKATMWEGMLNVIRNALGLGPRDVSAIEAAMGITEHAMWSRDPGMAMQAASRMARSQLEEGRSWLHQKHEQDQEAFLRTPREQLSRVRNIDRQMATEFAKDKWTNAKTITDKHVKLLAGTMMDAVHGHLFEDGKGRILEAINHARDKVSSTYKKLMGDDTDIINRGYFLDKRYASRMGDYARLVSMSNTYNIHADRAAPRVPKVKEDAARKYWQRNDKYGEARRIYESLPDELKARYTAEKNFYNGKFGGIGRVMIDKVLPLFDPPKGSTLEEVTKRFKDNDATDEDWAHYEKQGVDGSLRKAVNMINKKDAYFNAQRNGRWVVTGRYEMPAGGSEKDFAGNDLADNKREFNSESEAHDYAVGTHMHAVTHEVHYWTDKATGVTKRVPSDFATSDPGTEATKYQVRLERQNTQMADSRSMAERNRVAMEADGVKELSSVLDKRNEQAWSKINSADQKAIERKINSNPNLSDAERQHLRDTSRQMMLAGQGGMSSHFIHARKVAGAKFDTAAGLHAYAKAANYSMARDTHSNELDEAMSRLDEHEHDNQGDADATRRSVVANEYRNRVYGVNKDVLSSKVPPFINKLMSFAFVNFLARPSHIFLSQIHPFIYSVPIMGARHGYWKALQAQRQATKDLGGVTHNLWEGAKAGGRMAMAGFEKDMNKAVSMAHGVDPIDRMIAGLKNPEERKFLEQMRETEHLQSAFDASVFSGDGADRANAVIRQFTDAMEANNRLSTALAAYRLQKAMHGDKAEALSYARRVIEESHGVYSPTNMAPIFKNPIVKGALQFRQMPMNLAFNMYRNVGKAAMGDSEARWTLAYQLGTAAALGGMGGMPMDLPKLAGLAVQSVGGPSPADWADKEQRLLSEWIGETGANLINEGLPSLMGPLGPSLGHRTGFDAGFFFGEPKSDSEDDFLSYAAKMFAGASGDMALNWHRSLINLEHGDLGRAAETALPGSLADIAKMVRIATEGTTTGKQQLLPASYGEAILQGLGFSSLERERAFAGHFALQKELKAAEQAQPKTKSEQLKAKHQQSTLGVSIPKKQRGLAAEYESAYQ